MFYDPSFGPTIAVLLCAIFFIAYPGGRHWALRAIFLFFMFCLAVVAVVADGDSAKFLTVVYIALTILLGVALYAYAVTMIIGIYVFSKYRSRHPS